MSHPYSRWVLPLERVADVPGRAVVERREEVVVGTTAAGARQTARITKAMKKCRQVSAQPERHHGRSSSA